MSITISLRKTAFLTFVSMGLIFAFEYPSFSNNYTRNPNQADTKNEKDNTLKLNKPKSTKNTNLPSSKDIKSSMEVSEDGCIIKTLRFRNGVNLKIKQGCN